MWPFKTNKKPSSLTLRISLGKLFGAGIGLIIFLSLPTLHSEIDTTLRFGMWGWYIIFGGIIGLAGLYTQHPWFGWPMPPVLRGAVIGFGLNLVLGALVYQDMSQVFALYSEFKLANSMPILLMAMEGLMWGALIDSLLTYYAGEGKNLVKKL